MVHGGLSSVTNFDLDDIRGLPIGKSLQAVSLKNKGIVFYYYSSAGILVTG